MNKFFITLVTLFFVAAGSAHADDIHLWVGANECAECHEDESTAWQTSHHHKSFKKMPRSDEAKEIKQALGLKRLKTDKLCTQCHFSQIIKKNKPKSVAGPSCESCHGAAEHWIDVHGDYGGENVKKDEETPAHKKARWQKSEKAGMKRPKHYYKLYSECYGCHIVGKKELINKTEHTVASDFELVAWMSGEVRHNLWHNDGAENAPMPKKEQNLVYVLGHLLDLEFSLRALNSGAGSKRITDTLKQRLQDKITSLEKINAALGSNHLTTAISQAKTGLSGNNPKKAAESISKTTKAWLADVKIDNLSAVTKFLPSQSDYQGEAWQPGR